MYESFENGDLSNYEGDLTDYTIFTDPVYDGTYALEGYGDPIYRTENKAGPSRGETFRFYFQPENTFNGDVRCRFAVNSAHDTFYEMEVDQNGALIFRYHDPGGVDTLFNVSYDRESAGGTWRWVDIDFGDSEQDEIAAEAFKSDGTSAGSGSTVETRLDSGTFGWRIRRENGYMIAADALQEI